MVARLPFWMRRAEGAPTVQSLVIAAIAPDASERDRSLLGFQLDPEMNRARLTRPDRRRPGACSDDPAA